MLNHLHVIARSCFSRGRHRGGKKASEKVQEQQLAGLSRPPSLALGSPTVFHLFPLSCLDTR